MKIILRTVPPTPPHPKLWIYQLCELEIKRWSKINDNSAKMCPLGIPLQKEPGLLKEGDFNLGQEIFMMLLGNVVPQSKESKQKTY